MSLWIKFEEAQKYPAVLKVYGKTGRQPSNPNKRSFDQTVKTAFNSKSIATTSAAGTGTVATIGFAAQPTAPYLPGSSITISGMTPSGYNGTFQVTAGTTSSVSFASATTGAQTVAGAVVQAWVRKTPSLPNLSWQHCQIDVQNIPGVPALTDSGKRPYPNGP